jgi:hypothetical protein
LIAANSIRLFSISFSKRFNLFPYFFSPRRAILQGVIFMSGTPKRIYIKVLAEFDFDGKIIPLRIEVADGRHYDIDRFIRSERRAASGGGQTIRYEIKVRGQTRYLFHDVNTNQWFLEV